MRKRKLKLDQITAVGNSLSHNDLHCRTRTRPVALVAESRYVWRRENGDFERTSFRTCSTSILLINEFGKIGKINCNSFTSTQLLKPTWSKYAIALLGIPADLRAAKLDDCQFHEREHRPNFIGRHTSVQYVGQPGAAQTVLIHTRIKLIEEHWMGWSDKETEIKAFNKDDVVIIIG